MLTKHFDINEDKVIFEILMPAIDGRFLYYEFKNHKIIDKTIYNLKCFASVRDTGEPAQGTYQGEKNTASTHVLFYI